MPLIDSQGVEPDRPAARAAGKRGARRWRMALSLIITALFLVLLVVAVREVDWTETLRALRRFETEAVAAGIVLALLGHGAASGYELLGRRYEQHSLPLVTTATIGFVAYGLGMNLGALMGGWALRLRLYTRRGLAVRRIARLIGLSVLTNWSGYLLLAGLVFCLRPPAMPEHWPIDAAALRGLGLGLLLLCAGYLRLCASRPARHWHFRGVRLRCPPLRFAAAQIALSMIAWLLMASVIARFLPQSVPFTTVLAVLCLSSIAGLVVRMPAGLGVVETVFVSLLGPQLGTPNVLAAMLAYRACYYLLPLMLCLPLVLLLEASARRSEAGQAASRPSSVSLSR